MREREREPGKNKRKEIQEEGAGVDKNADIQLGNERDR